MRRPLVIVPLVAVLLLKVVRGLWQVASSDAGFHVGIGHRILADLQAPRADVFATTGARPLPKERLS